VLRGCLTLKTYDGCKPDSYAGHDATVCLCDSEKCNGAVMTSSFGHVVTVVALLVSVVIGYQLL